MSSGLPEMPPRLSGDGQIEIVRDGDDAWILSHTSKDGRRDHLRLSPYNAWRMLGVLSVMLGLPLSRAVSRLIKM